MRIVVSSTIDVEIPQEKKQNRSATDCHLFVCAAIEEMGKTFFADERCVCALLCIRTDGMSTDYIPRLFGSAAAEREKKQNKNNWLNTHTAAERDTVSAGTHTHHDEFRAWASALHKPPDFHGLARLSLTYL